MHAVERHNRQHHSSTVAPFSKIDSLSRNTKETHQTRNEHYRVFFSNLLESEYINPFTSERAYTRACFSGWYFAWNSLPEPDFKPQSFLLGKIHGIPPSSYFPEFLNPSFSDNFWFFEAVEVTWSFVPLKMAAQYFDVEEIHRII